MIAELPDLELMKATKYRIFLSDGKMIDQDAQNAGEAMETVLRKYRGRKVITCLSGQHSTNGKIEYEVPNHDAIPEGVVFAKRVRKTEAPAELFEDADVKGQGRLAD